MRIKQIIKDKDYRHFIIGCFVVIIFLITYYSSFINSSTECGKFYGTYRIRTTEYFEFRFFINGKERFANISTSQLSNRNIDSIENMGCVEITYSNWLPFFNKVTDKRIVK